MTKCGTTPWYNRKMQTKLHSVGAFIEHSFPHGQLDHTPSLDCYCTPEVLSGYGAHLNIGGMSIIKYLPVWKVSHH